MGTSQSKPSARGGSPLIPSWGSKDPPPPDGDSLPPPPPEHEQLEPRRTVGFRRSLGTFYKTGDRDDARRALGHFSRGSFGGGGAAGQRFSRAAISGGAAISALSMAVAGQPPVSGFDVASLAGRPVSEAIDAIVDAFCPPGILDEDAIRAAMAEALTEVLQGVDTFDPNQLDPGAILMTMRAFVAELVFQAVMAEEGESANDVPPLQAVERENDIRALVRDTTDREATSVLQNTQGPMTPKQVEGLVKAIVTEVGRELASW